ncbi:MAG: exodeoxyribonuclease VII small subunit [Clostridiales Family XIII bacterium]|jgi:exodeoxyribonuclease VII small subunit|nr:exodeoxyribonuclease VII small subunit [Clostridiales Family XIII bacterium]
MEDKTLTFEEALEHLESCADRISSKDVTLEEAIAAYEEGAAYYDQCDRILKGAKRRIMQIGPGADDSSGAGGRAVSEEG